MFSDGDSTRPSEERSAQLTHQLYTEFWNGWLAGSNHRSVAVDALCLAKTSYIC